MSKVMAESQVKLRAIELKINSESNYLSNSWTLMKTISLLNHPTAVHLRFCAPGNWGINLLGSTEIKDGAVANPTNGNLLTTKC